MSAQPVTTSEQPTTQDVVNAEIKRRKKGSNKGRALGPALCSEATRKMILGHIANGNYIVSACLAAGIDRDTFYSWETKGQEGIEPYASFWKELQEAENTAEVEIISNIKKLASKNWVGLMTLASRRFGDHWAQNQRIEGTIEHNHAITISLDRKPLIQGKVIEATIVAPIALESPQTVVADQSTALVANPSSASKRNKP